MGAQLGGKGAMSEINMTPLIDIVLVVLIIMMVNIPIQIEEMGLKLPSSEKPINPPPPDAEQLVVAMYEDGTVALNRRLMAEQKMLYELTRRLRPMAKKNVFIDAAAGVPYGRVVDLVDLAREAGAANVGLAKMKPEGPLPATEVDAGAAPRGITVGVSVRGEITEKKADEVFQPLTGSVRQCFFQRLGSRPDLTGNMVIYVEVGPQGELLKEPEIEKDAVGDLELRDCIKGLLPALKFEPLGDQKTAWVRYSVLFSPG